MCASRPDTALTIDESPLTFLLPEGLACIHGQSHTLSKPFNGIIMNTIRNTILALTAATAITVPALAQTGGKSNPAPNADSSAPIAAAAMSEGEIKKIDKEAGKV